jgi:hypothetical protein
MVLRYCECLFGVLYEYPCNVCTPNMVCILICLIFPAALGPGVYSASNWNEYQKHKKIVMFLGSKVRLVRRDDNLTAISEPVI